jgi:predicted lipoprotein with Yx(FWY)xxD motif
MRLDSAERWPTMGDRCRSEPTLAVPMAQRRPLLAAAVTAAVLFVSACGSTGTVDSGAAATSSTTSSSTTPEPTRTTPSPSPSPEAVAGTVLASGNSDFGPMLFDARGQAIYLFEIETAGVPDCYGECAAAWPPVLTTGAPQATGAVRPELLGTVRRDDGSTQVTYAGQPLYFYAHEGPGQVLCHDVVLNGGRWLVMTPEGAPGPV